MKEHRLLKPSWSVPTVVTDLPEAGRRVDLVADAAARAAVAAAAGVNSVDRLEASFNLSRDTGDGVRVVGQVSAIVGQTCVVTLEPLETNVQEPIDLVFRPSQSVGGVDAGNVSSVTALGSEDPPEVLQDGIVDLGAIATEFLILGVDPYPRKPDATFEPPAVPSDPEAHPFAALASLKKGVSS